MFQQPKLQVFQRHPIYKYGVEVPRNHGNTMELYHLNGNTLWSDEEISEMIEFKNEFDN